MIPLGICMTSPVLIYNEMDSLGLKSLALTAKVLRSGQLNKENIALYVQLPKLKLLLPELNNLNLSGVPIFIFGVAQLLMAYKISVIDIKETELDITQFPTYIDIKPQLKKIQLLPDQMLKLDKIDVIQDAANKLINGSVLSPLMSLLAAFHDHRHYTVKRSVIRWLNDPESTKEELKKLLQRSCTDPDTLQLGKHLYKILSNITGNRCKDALQYIRHGNPDLDHVEAKFNIARYEIAYLRAANK